MAASRAALGPDGLRAKVVVQRVRLGSDEYRVIRPARARNVALYADRGNDYGLYVDRTDGRQLGTLLMLAARSPRSLVYLPLRSNPGVPGIGLPDEQPLDLVLAPRARQFRPAHWKRLRTRVTTANAPRELRTAGSCLRRVHASARRATVRATPAARHHRCAGWRAFSVGGSRVALSRIRRQDSAISRETCICERPSSVAMALWVIPAKNRR